jgi:uncharacterized phage protein gp47/JayE
MPYFPSKTVEQLQQEYFQALANAGTGLRFDTTQGSVISALARGSAAVAASQYRDIRRLASSITLADAKGEDLDIYADFGIVRKQPTRSVGTVLAISPNGEIVVPAGSIFIDPQSTLQFESINQTPIKVSYLETPIQIRSLLTGPLANLQEGTRLYSQNFTGTSFVVGTARTPAGNYIGSLTGGANRESDVSYRNRIAAWLSSHTTASQSSVIDRLLSFPGVSRAFTITNSGGILEVWVDSLSVFFSESQRIEIARYIKDYVADGIIVTVSQVNRKPVDILLEVTPYTNAIDVGISSLSNRIREVTLSYIQQLTIGQNFSRSVLLQRLRPLAAQVIVKEPSQDVFILNTELAVLGKLQTTYPA